MTCPNDYLSLKDLQEKFTRSILARKLDGPIYTQNGQEIFRDAPGKNITVSQRMSVYRNNFRMSLQTVIEERHTLLKTLVGEEFLAALAQAYIQDNPPEHGDLNEYGFDFPDFVERVPAASGLPYLADVAHLECAWWRAYYAPDALPLDPAELIGALSSLPASAQNNVRFDLHPSVRLMRPTYPAFSIREMCLREMESNETPGKNPGQAENIIIDKKAEFGIILRPHLAVQVKQLPESRLKFLVYLRDGFSVGEAYGKVLGRYGTFDLVSALKEEIHRGSFSHWRV